MDAGSARDLPKARSQLDRKPSKQMPRSFIIDRSTCAHTPQLEHTPLGIPPSNFAINKRAVILNCAVILSERGPKRSLKFGGG